MTHSNRTTSHPFDKMLELTAALFAETEHALFWRQYLSQAESLLDIGCGNAAYLSELHYRYPAVAFTGIEADQQVFQSAIHRSPSGIRLIHDRYEDYRPERTYSAMLARLVILHIRNRIQLCAWMERYLKPGGLVFILDFADEKFEGDKLLPQFSALFRRLRAPLRKQRSFLSIQDTIRLEWTHYGFALLETHDYCVTSDHPEMKRRMLAYMRLITGQHGDAGQRESILKELTAWENDSHNTLTFPMFGLVFQKQQQQGRC